MLGWLRVTRSGIKTEGRGPVADVGSCHHRVEEGWIVVNANVLDLKRVYLLPSLLVEEVLLHGIVDLFSSHLILEVATNGLVDLVHVGGNVLPCKDGWSTKDTHRLTTVVV